MRRWWKVVKSGLSLPVGATSASPPKSLPPPVSSGMMMIAMIMRMKMMMRMMVMGIREAVTKNGIF